MNEELEKLVTECQPIARIGSLASYIPELLNYDKNALGICVTHTDGSEYFAGDCAAEFTIQSVAKPIIFACALIDAPLGQIMKKVSFEPTNDGFNSIVNLETRNEHKPLNPLINSGAIICLGFSKGGNYEQKYRRILEFLKIAVRNDKLKINEKVYSSEKATGSRNRSIAYYMKSTGLLEDDVEEVLDAYFKICSINVTCRELARFGAILANGGLSSHGERLFPVEVARTVNAVMTLCGMYDESGAVAVAAGMPSKSGVGGGIMSVSPGKLGIGIYGPSLNDKGSSVAGVELLKRFSEKCGTGIF